MKQVQTEAASTCRGVWAEQRWKKVLLCVSDVACSKNSAVPELLEEGSKHVNAASVIVQKQHASWILPNPVSSVFLPLSSASTGAVITHASINLFV